jgi:hypothetical protein
MNMRLADQDRQALDLMLDQGVTADDRQTGFVATPRTDEMRERIAAVGQVLSLLGQMPAENPPSDLVAKTMRRIARADAQMDAREITVPPLFTTDRPVA